jgi:hypothetical protein
LNPKRNQLKKRQMILQMKPKQIKEDSVGSILTIKTKQMKILVDLVALHLMMSPIKIKPRSQSIN